MSDISKNNDGDNENDAELFEWNGSNITMFLTCAEASIYSMDYMSTFMGLVKNRRASADFLDAPQLAEELKAIGELYASEAKEKQEQLKAAAGEETVGPSEDEEEATCLLVGRWFNLYNCFFMLVGSSVKANLF